MKRDIKNTKDIFAAIRDLLNQLEKAMDESSSSHKSVALKPPLPLTTEPKGPSGAVRVLINEGFFDQPKTVDSVMKRLKEIGYYYRRPAVAMNLLILTRKRILNRFENKETKSLEYVIRK